MTIKTIPLSAALLARRRIRPTHAVGIDLEQAIKLTGCSYLPAANGISRAMILQLPRRVRILPLPSQDRLLAVCVGAEWVVLSETIPHTDWAAVFGPDWAPEPANPTAPMWAYELQDNPPPSGGGQ